MINSVVLVGRLTKDPELRKTQNGTSVCYFTLAVGRRYKTPGQPDADFINCTAWNKTAELLCTYQRKGSLVGITGRVQTRSYDDQQGQRVFRTDIIAETVDFLESKAAAAAHQNTSYGQDTGYSSGGYNQGYQNNSYGNQGGYNQPSYGGYSSSYSSNPSSGGYNPPNQGYSQPSSDFGPDSSGFDDAFDESSSLDISSDDLPF